MDKALEAQLTQAEALQVAGKSGEAKSLLDKIDRRFGGLAAPRSLTLDAALEKPAK